MKALSTILRILAILGALAAAYFWYDTNGKLAQKQKELDNLSLSHSDAVARAEQADAQVKNLTTQTATLQDQLKTTKSQVDVSERTAMEARREADNATAKLSSAEKRAADLQVQVDSLKIKLIQAMPADGTSIESLNEKIMELSKEITEKNTAINALNTQIAQLNARLGKDIGDQVNQGVKYEYEIRSIDPKKGVCVITGPNYESMRPGQKYLIQSRKPGVTGSSMTISVSEVNDYYVVADILPDNTAWNVNKFIDGQLVILGSVEAFIKEEAAEAAEAGK